MIGAVTWLGSGNTQLSMVRHPVVPRLGAQIAGGLPAQSIAQGTPNQEAPTERRERQDYPWLWDPSAQLIAQPVHHLSPAVLNYLQATLSQNTKRAYQQDLHDFLVWGGHVPCTEEMLSAYLAERAVSLSVHTLQRRLVGIGHAHVAQGWPNPCRSRLVRAVMQGIKRTKGVAQRQCDPILNEHLPILLRQMRGFRGIRDRALVLIGFAAALRRSELACLHVRDIERVGGGLLVHVRRSKTDQAGVGRRIAVPMGQTDLCPVDAYETWIQASGINKGPVFRAVSRYGVLSAQAMTAQSIALILKDYAAQAGLGALRISGHSLRAGLVTSAAQAGIPAHKIQQQTGHKSLAMLSVYIRDARLFEGNAAGGVL